LILSPVPVTGDNISLTFLEAAQAGSEIAITNTSGQRMLRYTTQASNDEALSLPVGNLAPGVYIVSVQVPGQVLRYARFIKM
jgi:methionine-rich copper-binding protein CopC